MIRDHGRNGPQPDLDVGVFRNEGGYYLEDGEGSEELKAKHVEHREASVWHGKDRRRWA